MTIDQLKRIDLLLDSYTIMYNDIDVTYLLRNHVVANVRNKNGKGHSEISLDKRAIWRLLTSLLITLPVFFLRRSIWVFSNAERRKKIDNTYVDRVASMVSRFCNSVLFIETSVLTQHKFPTSDKVLSESWLYLLSWVFGRILFKPQKITVQGDLVELEKTLGIKINIVPRVKRFVAQYEAMKWLLKYRRGPKIVFVVYPNGYSGYIRAFKEKKIPVVELQHGIIYPLHYSYNCFLNRDISSFYPDYILTYGLRDKQTLEELSYLPPNNIIPVGSYTLWLYREQNLSTSQYLMDLFAKHQGKKNIAITATVHDLEVLYKLATEIGQLNSEYHFYLMPRNEGQELKSNQYVDVLNPVLCNVYEVMNLCDGHITMASTCGVEALYFNKPSIVYEDVRGESMFRKNYPFLKTLQYASDIKELIALLNKPINQLHIDEDIRQLFLSDTAVRFTTFMESLHE